MKLIEPSSIQNCSPEQLLVLVRHGVDVSTLSQDLNQPLTEETKPDIRKFSKQMIRFFEKVGVTKIFIYHSNRLRAIQTAGIVAEELFSANFLTEIRESAGVREIYQGNFRITEDHVHGTDYKPLLDAWIAWQQKLDECELLYRFGDPVIDSVGNAQYSDLVGWFKEFGEHQADFSLRLYRLLKEVFESKDTSLQVIIGHQASCSRIQRILNAVTKLERVDQFEPGDFVRILEKRGDRVTIEPACGVIVKKPDQSLALEVFRKEIKFLESIV
jgi:broad specificity phosphatase PhoE